MKKLFLLICVTGFAMLGRSQKIDSIFFHLYTDSLKKGTHNYINVDGKTSEGKWKPLSGKDIVFTTTYGKFEGNELILPDEVSVEKLTIKAVLRSDPNLSREITIWIKQKPDDEILPTKEEILKGKPSKKNSKN